MRFRFFLALSLSLSLLCAHSAELPDNARQEINFLLTHLEQSGCEFGRNGNWYAATEASAHLRKKFAYLEQNELIVSAEDFIVGGASSSSISKHPYLVRCPNTPVTESGPWLKKALEKHRQANRR